MQQPIIILLQQPKPLLSLLLLFSFSSYYISGEALTLLTSYTIDPAHSREILGYTPLFNWTVGMEWSSSLSSTPRSVDNFDTFSWSCFHI